MIRATKDGTLIIKLNGLFLEFSGRQSCLYPFGWLSVSKIGKTFLAVEPQFKQS
jgi:hypothetical protein